MFCTKKLNKFFILKPDKSKQLVVLLIFVIFISGCQADEVSQKLKSFDEKIGEGFKEIQNKQQTDVVNLLGNKEVSKLSAKDLSKEQKEKIDKWLEEKKLNRYGDPAETVYTGGTPLFNETTGESVDRYDYILKNHPELSDELK